VESIPLDDIQLLTLGFNPFIVDEEGKDKDDMSLFVKEVLFDSFPFNIGVK
jgi:hypothetical protein